MPVAVTPSAPALLTPPSRGERLAWFFFLATSVHLVFLRPYITVIPGEHAKVFCGIWCTLSLFLALAFHRGRPLTWKSPPALISLTLFLLATASSLLSPTQASSLARAFVILAAGLGGFWGARLLLHSPQRQRQFIWFVVGLQVIVLLLCLLGLGMVGSIFWFLDEHYHPVGSRLILLSFAPLALLFSPSRLQVLLGLGLLASSYVALFLVGRNSGMGSAVLIPVALALVAAALHSWSRRQLALLLAGLLLAACLGGNLLWTIVQEKNQSHESVAYRVENLRFSWHLARQHPFFGIGLLAPREPYLKDYKVRYPYLTQENFSVWTRELRTSENNFLTFLADLGLPFTLLYAGAVLVILTRLWRRTLQPLAVAVLPPLALLLPLVGEIMHFQVLDGLLHPQISWFFHILLGLGVATPANGPLRPGAQRAVVVRLLALSAVIAAGAALGIMLAPWLSLRNVMYSVP
jgi:hypothetical protein